MPPPAAEPAVGTDPECWALVVGLGRYSPHLDDLDGPERDAQEFYAWVTDPAGGRVPAGQANLIISTADTVRTREPSQAVLMRACRAYDALARAHEKDHGALRLGRRLYLYFSGHGYSPDERESVLLAADAKREEPGLHVPGRAWAEHFRRIGAFDEVVLFMDCCRDNYPRVAPQPIQVPSQPDGRGQDRPYFFGFATKWNRRARELPIGGQVRGVFTYALLKGLRGAAADAVGRVTTRSLCDWLDANLAAIFPADVRDQFGDEFDPDFDPKTGDDLLLATAERPAFEIDIHVDPARQGKRLRLQRHVSGINYDDVDVVDAAPALWTPKPQVADMYLVIDEDGHEEPFRLTGVGGRKRVDF